MIEPVIVHDDRIDLVYFKQELEWNGYLSSRPDTREIILHCTDTPDGKDFNIEQIHEWHLERDYAGCGYNYVIYRDGIIVEGRPMDKIGAHCSGHNSKSIGICYVGGANGKDTRTTEQKEALYQLCYYLMGYYGLGLEDIHCHNEFSDKKCPGFKILDFRNEYLKWIKKF